MGEKWLNVMKESEGSGREARENTRRIKIRNEG